MMMAPTTSFPTTSRTVRSTSPSRAGESSVSARHLRCVSVTATSLTIRRRSARIFADGAYAGFKGLLEEKRLLETWYKYEARRTRETALEWGEAENVTIGDGRGSAEP